MQTYSEQMLLERIVRLEKEMEELKDNQKKDKRLIDYLYGRQIGLSKDLSTAVFQNRWENYLGREALKLFWNKR